jgi:ABC-type lipoprotein export system ATPase subunit/ABC-type uncharacterized transport system permease subunit
MTNLFEILQIGILDGLIWFPFVLGVGLIYKHQKIIDVSIDGISILCGITCGLIWTSSQSYLLSVLASVICGISAYTLLWFSIQKLRINPMLAGILFSIIAYAVSVLIVGESLVLKGTDLFPSFSSFSFLPLIIAIAIALVAEFFYKTNIGTSIRFIGGLQNPNIKIDPHVLTWLGFTVTATIVGIGAAIYVHKQGVARSGVGFEFLITSLSSFLLIDRLVEFVTNFFSRTRSSLFGRTAFLFNNILQSVAFKALVGSIIFQIIVLLIIVNTPNPIYWKLFFGLVLLFCVAHPQPPSGGKDKSSASAATKNLSGVRLENISAVYNLGYDTRTIFKSLNISFAPGINYIWGPNGSGKSTLLGCIQGNIKVQSGSIAIDADEVTNLPTYKRNVFLLSQNPFMSISAELRVYENIVVASDAKRNPIGFCSPDEILRELKDALFAAGLNDIIPDDGTILLQETKSLSGGQAQRISFYMALLSRSNVILADEPSSGLDTENLNRLINILEKMAATGKTIIIATHDNRLAKMNGQHYEIRNGNVFPIQFQQKFERQNETAILQEGRNLI